MYLYQYIEIYMYIYTVCINTNIREIYRYIHIYIYMNVSDARTTDSGLESEGDLVSRLTVQLKGFLVRSWLTMTSLVLVQAWGSV